MTAPGGGPWEVVVRTDAAADFHAREVPGTPGRSVWVCEPAGSAVVLGSTQADSVVDGDRCRAAGIDVVRRRSGGGAVLVVPGDLLWVDLVVPRHDPLWSDDVGIAAHWVGDAWTAALGDLGIAGRSHTGALVRTAWSDLVCFAGLGPGEVTLDAGPKVVGVSQRRTRGWARFQCAALLRWDPVLLLSLLSLGDADRARASVDLAAVADGLTVAREDLLASLLGHLP